MLRRDDTLSNALDDLASPAPRLLQGADAETPNPVARGSGRGSGGRSLPGGQALEQETAAAVAGMARSRAVYFDHSLLDALFWLRNQHPILGCFAAHPLHPFRRSARLRLLSVAVLFAVLTSVVTLLECAAATVAQHDGAGDSPGDGTETFENVPAHPPLPPTAPEAPAAIDPPLCPAEQALANCEPYQSCYHFRIVCWAVVGAVLQLMLEMMAVCACIQPGGVLHRCCAWRICCGEACMEKGQQAILFCQVLAVILLISATLLAHDAQLQFGVIVAATLRTKLFSAGLAIAIQLTKFVIWRRIQRPYWDVAYLARKASGGAGMVRGAAGELPPLLTNRVYLASGLPTARFLRERDFAVLQCAGARGATKHTTVAPSPVHAPFAHLLARSLAGGPL